MRFCTENNIVCEDGIPMIHHINYLFNPLYFNMHSASAYLQAAGELRNAMIEKNDFDFICESEFEPLLSRLEAMGHSKKNLLAQTHRLIARRC